MTVAEVLALIKLIEDLAPSGVGLVKSLIDRLTGVPEAQIAAIAHQINAGVIASVNAELAKLPPGA